MAFPSARLPFVYSFFRIEVASFSYLLEADDGRHKHQRAKHDRSPGKAIFQVVNDSQSATANDGTKDHHLGGSPKFAFYNYHLPNVR
jgi:hypothetical protein